MQEEKLVNNWKGIGVKRKWQLAGGGNKNDLTIDCILTKGTKVKSNKTREPRFNNIAGDN